MKETQYINPYKLFNGAFMPNWLMERHSTDINPNAKIVYARLLQYAGEDGKAYPKVDTLGKRCGLSPTSVRRTLNELSDLGLLERVRRGLQQSNMYLFPYHHWMEMRVTDVEFKKNPSAEVQKQLTSGGSLHIEDKTNKSIKNGKVKIDITSWENNNGILTVDHPDLINWIAEKKLSKVKLSTAMDDFKNNCEAKGYKYISFPAAFRTWCNSTQFGRPGISTYVDDSCQDKSAAELQQEEIDKWTS